MNTRITLEQWRTLVAVVDCGGYAQAAARLNKSQSAVTYAIQKMESLLELKVFMVEGRKAVLTGPGEQLYQHARMLLEDALGMEQLAATLKQGWEAEIRIAAEVVFPTWLLLEVMHQFGQESPATRVELIESVMGGTSEALLQGRVDLAIAPAVPPGFAGELLMPMRVLPVAHPDHPLHQLGRRVRVTDLRRHRHIVVRDTGSARETSTMTVEARKRWVVGNMATSIHALCQGYGFAWMVEDKIRNELRKGQLKALPMQGQERMLSMYSIIARPEQAGPGVRRLAELLGQRVRGLCKLARAAQMDADQR